MRHSERPSEGEVPNDTPCCSPPTSAIVERHYNHTESGHTHTRIENNKNNAHSDSSDIEINVTVSDADIASMSIHREDRTLEYHFAEADIATNSDVHTSPTEGNKSALRRSVRQRKTVCEEKLTPLPTRKRPTHQHEIETPIYTTKQETETSHLTGESITLTQTQDEFACSSQESVDEFACSSQETVDDELRVSKIGKGRGKKNPGKAVAKRKVNIFYFVFFFVHLNLTFLFRFFFFVFFCQEGCVFKGRNKSQRNRATRPRAWPEASEGLIYMYIYI